MAKQKAGLDFYTAGHSGNFVGFSIFGSSRFDIYCGFLKNCGLVNLFTVKFLESIGKNNLNRTFIFLDSVDSLEILIN